MMLSTMERERLHALVDERIKRSRKQEARGAKRYGGSVNSGSGNGWVRKNDVRTEDLSIEYKSTLSKQFTLRLNELAQARRYALLEDRMMVFGIEIKGENFVVLDDNDFHEMLEQIDGLQREILELHKEFGIGSEPDWPMEDEY